MNKNDNVSDRRSLNRVIAITGCDGAGKSTLASRLVNSFPNESKVTLVYLGQSSGYIGKWLSNLPIIGSRLGRYLLSKSSNVHQRPSTPPGSFTALVIFLLSCWRAWKFYRMMLKSRRGYLVVTDRYPQAEVAGFRVDGPQLAKAESGNRWVRFLRRQEQRLYTWMASYPPALLIRLNIDEYTAFERKPDHAITSLREKISTLPRLTFNGATILDLDAREPKEKIVAWSLQAMRTALIKHHASIR